MPCRAASGNFVKTLTGFGAAGATAADVALLRRVLASRAGVKSAGGIGTLAEALDGRCLSRQDSDELGREK